MYLKSLRSAIFFLFSLAQHVQSKPAELNEKIEVKKEIF